MENYTTMGKDYENFYLHGGCLNKDWKTEPGNEWGTVGGTADQSTRELPICALQRKNVEVYAKDQSKDLAGLCSIHFIPRGSKENAEAIIARHDREMLRELGLA